eukprot:sb/3475263/
MLCNSNILCFSDDQVHYHLQLPHWQCTLFTHLPLPRYKYIVGPQVPDLSVSDFTLHSPFPTTQYAPPIYSPPSSCLATQSVLSPLVKDASPSGSRQLAPGLRPGARATDVEHVNPPPPPFLTIALERW